MWKTITQPVVFDGIMYFMIAVFGFLATAFGSDEAKQYVAPHALFWLRMIFGAMSAGALSVKMYRSTTFSEYKQAKNGSYHAPDQPTTVLTPQNKPATVDTTVK